MRLLHAKDLHFKEFFENECPNYAILSHRWNDQEQEVTYRDFLGGEKRDSRGYAKIVATCEKALAHKYNWIWIDTCCIDKDSSAELSEAINSMFFWYRRSSTCFVYLDDFRYDEASLAGLESSRWFTRGWTLQELLAPRTVQFFDASWTEFGTRKPLISRISNATSIPIQYLLQQDLIRLASVDKNSSAELSEAINSVFRWYQSAAECYVCLSNVSGEETETGSHPSKRLSFSQEDLPAMRVLNAKSLDFKDRTYSILLHRWQYDEKAEQDNRWFTQGWVISELLATLDNPGMSQEPCSQSGLVYLETLCWSAIGRTPRRGRGCRKNSAYWESLHTSPQQDTCFLPLFSGFGTSFSEPLDSKPDHNERLDHRGHGIFPDACEPRIMKISDPFVGDEGFGPNFGEPDMSREDDDDDNCVGFHRFSGVANRAINLLGGEGGLNGTNAKTQLPGETLGGIIPKFGPPKRDPVAATLGGPVRYCADQTTLRDWRDAIVRTCGMDTGFGTMPAKTWEEIGRKSAWEMYGNARGEGEQMCAY